MKNWLKKSTISPYNVPEWLSKLPPGEYSIMQICKITGQTYANIYLRLKILEVKTRKVPLMTYQQEFDSEISLHGRDNVTVYDWRGYQHHLVKAAENRVAALKKGPQK